MFGNLAHANSCTCIISFHSKNQYLISTSKINSLGLLWLSMVDWTEKYCEAILDTHFLAIASCKLGRSLPHMVNLSFNKCSVLK